MYGTVHAGPGIACCDHYDAENPTFTCAGCGRVCGYCMGSDDDMPDHCDDCWDKAHSECEAAEEAITAADIAADLAPLSREECCRRGAEAFERGPMIPQVNRNALLSRYTSRQNKLWLAIGWIHRAAWFLEYRWAGAYMRSRMQFLFEPSGQWHTAESYDEDIVPTLKFGREGK